MGRDYQEASACQVIPRLEVAGTSMEVVVISARESGGNNEVHNK